MQDLSSKYRPRLLSQVWGQSHITQALSNVAKTGALDAYRALLFTGKHGSGKTSTARIIARLYNCPNSSTGEPCNVCDNCKLVDQQLVTGTMGDIIELNAASNRGIADIKALMDAIAYYPSNNLRKKVIILDEAHQLTHDAKDAFLKTLEQPPAHVVFILATTQRDKIPPTLASRCVPFVFRNGTDKDIADYLAAIMQVEQVPYEDEALMRIAVQAFGSYRDGLKILEGFLMNKEPLTAVRVTGVLSENAQLIAEALAGVAKGDIAKAITAGGQAAINGVDMTLFSNEVIDRLNKYLQAMAQKGIVATPIGVTLPQMLEVVMYLHEKTVQAETMDPVVLSLALAGAAAKVATYAKGSG